MKKFLKWWKLWGQILGFVLHILILSSLIIVFEDDIRDNGWLLILWVILFYAGAIWYAWQMKKHGWDLPKDIRDTHTWN